MRHNIQPLAIPCQYARPHLITLKRGDLTPEGTEYGAKADAKGAFSGVSVLVEDKASLGVGGEFGHGAAEDVGDEMGTADVHIGEIGGVALVHVVVGLEEGGAAGSDRVVEESALGEVTVGPDDVVDEGVEHADLLVVDKGC